MASAGRHAFKLRLAAFANKSINRSNPGRSARSPRRWPRRPEQYKETTPRAGRAPAPARAVRAPMASPSSRPTRGTRRHPCPRAPAVMKPARLGERQPRNLFRQLFIKVGGPRSRATLALLEDGMALRANGAWATSPSARTLRALGASSRATATGGSREALARASRAFVPFRALASAPARSGRAL